MNLLRRCGVTATKHDTSLNDNIAISKQAHPDGVRRMTSCSPLSACAYTFRIGSQTKALLIRKKHSTYSSGVPGTTKNNVCDGQDVKDTHRTGHR